MELNKNRIQDIRHRSYNIVLLCSIFDEFSYEPQRGRCGKTTTQPKTFSSKPRSGKFHEQTTKESSDPEANQIPRLAHAQVNYSEAFVAARSFGKADFVAAHIARAEGFSPSSHRRNSDRERVELCGVS